MSVETVQSPREAAEPPVYIANAGLVLLSPFLPHLFDRLDLLTVTAGGEPRITGPEAASRAVHLLQYLVTGQLDAPASDLLLNRLLAGVPPSTEIAPRIDPPAQDLEICESLLAATIHNWPLIRNSSHAALRETFLQREGRLQRAGDGWRLLVQRKSVDVLVDQIPWSFSLIFHRWMSGAVAVTW